jgi:hypothetical protein
MLGRSKDKEAALAEPKLTLQYSASNWLDAVLVDARSRRPLYVVETRERDTYILWVTPEERLQCAAQIHWPKKTRLTEAGVLNGGPGSTYGIRVQMSGRRWRDSEEFLKFGSSFTYVRLHPRRAPLTVPISSQHSQV